MYKDYEIIYKLKGSNVWRKYFCTIDLVNADNMIEEIREAGKSEAAKIVEVRRKDIKMEIF